MLRVEFNLAQERFNGLVREGCQCGIEQLAPCGRRPMGKRDRFISGCRPGHRYDDPAGGRLWLIRERAPTEGDWEKARAT